MVMVVCLFSFDIINIVYFEALVNSPCDTLLTGTISRFRIDVRPACQ